ncbi:MAG: hypothetical protein KGN77_12930 [Xanthomonadaceae bacterium]|nr:hypothetical protein [Xanthomonadaceae bacterium]
MNARRSAPLSVGLTLALVMAGLAAAFVLPEGAAATVHTPAVHELPGGVWLAGQVTPAQLRELRARGLAAVVAVRPDGEAPGQPSAAEMARAAHALGIAFDYVPVAPGTMPAEAVAAPVQPVLVYCRSGHRAAHIWALAEASRPGGLEATAIEAAVRSAGQSVDDIDGALRSRVAARPVPTR